MTLLTPQEIADYIITPEINAHRASARCSVTGHGIYALFAADDQLLYIGKSQHVSDRLAQHFIAARYRQGQKFSYFSALDVPKYLYSDMEIAHIYALRPPNNTLYEIIRHPNHKAMVEAISKAWYVIKECHDE